MALKNVWQSLFISIVLVLSIKSMEPEPQKNKENEETHSHIGGMLHTRGHLINTLKNEKPYRRRMAIASGLCFLASELSAQCDYKKTAWFFAGIGLMAIGSILDVHWKIRSIENTIIKLDQTLAQKRIKLIDLTR